MRNSQPMAVNEREWFSIEPLSTARRGVLDATRWRSLNKLLGMSGMSGNRDDRLGFFAGITKRRFRKSKETFGPQPVCLLLQLVPPVRWPEHALDLDQIAPEPRLPR